MPAQPTKVFVSYAHSTADHAQRITDLVGVLREHGLTVVVDADVKTPQGPEEGWPRWMKRQIKDANWVLIIFDDVYRRRFDGEEEVDKGLGASWEGAIITHQLYREAVRNTRFIPLLADDASTRLIPDELAGATYYRIPRQSGELAIALAQTVGAALHNDAPGPTKPDSASQPCIAPTRLRHGAEHLFGREQELAALDEAWSNPATHVLTFVAWGGVGKTSLVVEWMARQAAAGWVGFERVFDWSFYSQGTREQGGASGDTFIAEALKFFGDAALAGSPASPWDKGARLAQLVAQRRTLLVLDGLEPLQYPPGPLGGKLKDPAVEALLKGLAQRNPGLCVVTTREPVADLAPFHDTTAPEWDLEHLSEEAGAAVLHRAGANRAGAAAIEPDDAELRAASREVEGHALTLRLLGGYLALTADGDIRQRVSGRLADADCEYKTNPADADKPYGHAFKVMGVYEKWLAEGGEDGQRQLAVLRLLGLFDRPAKADCLAALRREPGIAGLTEALVSLSEAQWKATIKRLSDCGLVLALTPSSEIDAHPLIREYFAQQLRENNPEAWRAAHRRLYEHLTSSTQDKPQPTLDELQPLYQAVAHGCLAGVQQEACNKVYFDRILRGSEFYSTRKLGAVGADLGAVACFFEQAWTRVASALSEGDQAWLLGEAATRLRALGRLTEALEPMRGGLEMRIAQERWINAAISAGNLSELELTLGRVADAVSNAEQSVTYADRSGDAFQRMCRRTTLADALCQVGRHADALARFQEAEGMQAERQSQYPLLYSLRGFQYCDLLLAEAERAAWRRCLEHSSQHSGLSTDGAEFGAAPASCCEVERRAAQTLKWAEQAGQDILSAALDYLTLGRVALFRAILAETKAERDEALPTARQQLTAAVDGLRRAGSADHIPRGLLCRAWLRSVDGDTSGARADLDEAWQIAERGPMRLFMADIHLYRARLFHAVTPYPWTSAKDDLAAARKMISECGYHRRDEELADAEAALLA